jgi:2-dehydropantoate 2-reductase
VPIQNGFDPQLDDWDHDVEGISSFVSECEANRPITRITRPGALHLGGRGGASPGMLWMSPLAALIRRAKLFRVFEVEDIRPIKYTKLMYNAAISPLAAAAGIDNGDLLRVPLARKLFFDLLRENYAILRHANKPLGKVGPFHPDTVMKILKRNWLSRGLAFAFYPGLRGTYCSMSGDISKGRTEIANYNERLVEWAGEFPCPLNRRVVQVVRRIERDHEPPRLAMLDQFVVEPGP